MSRLFRAVSAAALFGVCALSGCDGVPDCEVPTQPAIPAPATLGEEGSSQDTGYQLLRSADGKQLIETYTRDGKRYRVVYQVESSSLDT